MRCRLGCVRENFANLHVISLTCTQSSKLTHLTFVRNPQSYWFSRAQVKKIGRNLSVSLRSLCERTWPLQTVAIREFASALLSFSSQCTCSGLRQERYMFTEALALGEII
eukprot:1956794-Amphidinium_carterae.1